MQSPKSINRLSHSALKIVWRDGFSAVIKLELIRKECPCAGCKGEELGEKKPKHPKIQIFSKGMFQLTELKTIGNYAINPIWGDGHDTGFYDWEYFRELCVKYKLSDEEISKIS